jgi:hypothetical protein
MLDLSLLASEETLCGVKIVCYIGIDKHHDNAVFGPKPEREMALARLMVRDAPTGQKLKQIREFDR